MRDAGKNAGKSDEFQKLNSIAFKGKKKCITIIFYTELKEDIYKNSLKKIQVKKVRKIQNTIYTFKGLSNLTQSRFK